MVDSVTTAASARAVEGPGAELWAQRYDGPAHSHDVATSVGVSPDGTTVYVTGISFEFAPEPEISDYATVAYDASTGTERWLARYKGVAPNSNDEAYSLGVSPDGTTVYVTGGSGGHYATVAYAASTGAERWVARDDSPIGGTGGIALSLRVSPDGKRVYVTGISGWDYVTIAYEASTGTKRWRTRYDGPAHSTDTAYSVTVSPDGTRVYVTGESYGRDPSRSYATIAYDASSGVQLWAKRTGGVTVSSDSAYSLEVSPDGTSVFVTGTSRIPSNTSEYLTIAYNALTGAQLWARRYRGPQRYGEAHSLGVNPDGATVYVTGSENYEGYYTDYATIAYDASTGAQLWVARYDGPSHQEDRANSLRVSPDGTFVFVIGESESDYATVAYDASTGAELWVARYDGPAHGDDRAHSLAVSADGTRVFVTGQSDGESGYDDYATVAYSAR
jgi:outer membrane protein assembly factor BamB